MRQKYTWVTTSPNTDGLASPCLMVSFQRFAFSSMYLDMSAQARVNSVMQRQVASCGGAAGGHATLHGGGVVVAHEWQTTVMRDIVR